MNKKIIRREQEKQIVEVGTSKKDKVIRRLNLDFSNDKMIDEYLDLMAKEKLLPKEQKRIDEVELKIAKIFGLDIGLWTANLSYRRNYEFLATVRSNLVKEFDCKNSLELMLVDRIVANYWRTMRGDYVYNLMIEQEDGGYSFDQLKINAMKELSKAIDTANRQLESNIILLRELKQPKLNVKVSTKNAYISQNQQVINNSKDESKTESNN